MLATPLNRILIAVLLTLLVVGESGAQPSEVRIALIIANEEYESHLLGRLPGTQRDAEAMQSALEQIGFQVTVRRNLRLREMRRELIQFSTRLQGLGRSGVGFFYYSGHGMADDARSGRNYLLPVDARIEGVTDLPTYGISLDEQLETVGRATPRAAVFVVDACRSTPISRRRGQTGLAPVLAPLDAVVGFSTGPGETADDNGLYAAELSRQLVQPNLSIEEVFSRVQRAVSAQTNRRQIPEYHSRLVDPVVLRVSEVYTPLSEIRERVGNDPSSQALSLRREAVLQALRGYVSRNRANMRYVYPNIPESVIATARTVSRVPDGEVLAIWDLTIGRTARCGILFFESELVTYGDGGLWCQAIRRVPYEQLRDRQSRPGFSSVFFGQGNSAIEIDVQNEPQREVIRLFEELAMIQ